MACDDSRLDNDCEYDHRNYRTILLFSVIRKQTENDIFPADRDYFVCCNHGFVQNILNFLEITKRFYNFVM